MLNTSDWLDFDTKIHAKEKLAYINLKIWYPDQLKVIRLHWKKTLWSNILIISNRRELANGEYFGIGKGGVEKKYFL